MNEQRLYEILGLRRKHESLGEAELVRTVLDPYIGRTLTAPNGEVLAYTTSVPGVDGLGSRTLFSCHIDTIVHGGPNMVGGLFNQIFYDEEKNTLHAGDNTLGADDGAGMWLLLEMIDAGVPGTYIFHRGEECGGIGSSGIARHHIGFLKGFDRAIAFDRRGTHSVITHQGSARCCSEDFAGALAEQLTTDVYFFAGDTGGSFTDTKNYTGLIGECTNVSIGYENEHGTSESLDLNYLFAMRDQCVTVSWEDLPTVRKAGDVEYLKSSWAGYGAAWTNDDDLSGYYSRLENMKAGSKPLLDHTTLYAMSTEEIVEYLTPLRYVDILSFCEEYPEYAADVLHQMLFDQAMGVDYYEDEAYDTDDTLLVERADPLKAVGV